MTYHIYVRCSTEEQAKSGMVDKARCKKDRNSDDQKGLGTEAQLQACRKWIAANDPDNEIREYADEGVSSRKVAFAKRKELMRAINSCKRGDTMIVLKRDRIARDVIENATVDQLVENKKARVLSIECDDTNIDLPLARLYRTIRDSFSQYEAALISQRVTEALQVKKRRGEIIGRTPYGYRVKKREGVKVLAPNPYEQAVLALMQQKREEGYSFRALTEWLNESGIKNRQGNIWHTRRLWEIMRREEPIAVEGAFDHTEEMDVEYTDQECLDQLQSLAGSCTS